MTFGESKRFSDKDLPSQFPERRSGDVVVPGKAGKIDFGENVTKGIVGESQHQIVTAAHFPFEIETDVR